MIAARWGLVAALAMLAADSTSDINLDVRAVLTRYLRFGSVELADLQRGKVVRHGIDTNAAGEIAVAGAVKVNAAKSAWGDRFTLKRYHDGVISFGSPPVRFVRSLLLNEPIPE